ncbi:MAG TPA: DUF262 domain-containing protein [Patescibacteria group bacterium]|nr:DUF262 domain-containing protein [Patescibacteria group bacterium]
MRCEPARDFTVGKAIAWRSSIDDDPAYQRAGDVWSLAQRRLFIDSLLNGYDVPKIYLHDLRGQHPTKVYAVVDGRQRLTTLWSFVRDGFRLDPAFRIEAPGEGGGPDDGDVPAGARCFSELGQRWRTALLRTPLSVVLIRDATESDIEELFSRLNNGVALSPAERRNALGGAMVALIREAAATSDLVGALAFPGDRGGHLEVAARLLAGEDARPTADRSPPDSPAALDSFVRRRRHLSDAERTAHLQRLEGRWSAVADQFGRPDPRLSDPDAAVAAVRAAWRALDDASVRSGPVGAAHEPADPIRPD